MGDALRAGSMVLAAATLALSASPTSPTPPAAQFAAAHVPPHATPAADYTLHASLDPGAHTVHGSGTIVWRNASSAAVREVWVHLYLNAFKSEASLWRRERVAGARGAPLTDAGSIDVRRFALRGADGSSNDLWPAAELRRAGDADETDARVPLPREVAPGDAIAIDVEWDDKLPNVVERTGYSSRFHMVGQWFPKIARIEPDGRWAHFPFHRLAEFYADYGVYDVTLDVPQDFILGATGPVVEGRIAAGRRVERHVQADVHDFAWTAWDQWQTANESIDGVRVAVLFPPGFDGDARRELDAMRFALPWLGARYGRYPYEVLTLVHPPPPANEATGMEYPTLITTGGRWYGPPGVFDLEQTAVHELAHQWFYGLVGTNEVEWPFLDEGLTTYAQVSAMHAWRGPGDLVDLFGLKIGSIETSGYLAGREHDAPVAQPAYAFASGYDYVSLVYDRAAAIFLTLERVYGEPAVRALGRYARRYRFQHPTPDELLAICREELGEEVHRTLRAALFEKGWVDYVVAEVASDPAEGGGFEGSVLVRRRGTLSFPVDIELVRADGSRERRRWDGEADEARLEYRGEVSLRAAVVDPDHRVLLDADPSNDSALAPGEPSSGAPRTFERLLYWAALAAEAVAP